ncbi:MAG: enoyl-ACP reductase [Armatimonadota bacterium]|nr:enoyl-ACP reductase [Armatimonadota bacterium]MDR7548370.1 enoyl-ACP reductase [Armatimonadota bacterium]
MLLEGKRALIMGVANNRSIAWGIARAFQREGASLAFTYQNERLKDNLVELLREIGGAEAFPTFKCDVTSDEEIAAVFEGLGQRWGTLNVLVHCLAYANREDLSRPFSEISRRGYAMALDVSAYSLIRCAGAARPLLEAAGGGSIMTLTYNAVERVVPSYSVMAVAKAALECEVRYLAAELGPKNIRVNAISAGPLRTLAASAVRGLSGFRDAVEEIAPLRRNVTQEDVADVAVFLASDLSRAVTGNTIFADSGFHVMGVAGQVEVRKQREG